MFAASPRHGAARSDLGPRRSCGGAARTRSHNPSRSTSSDAIASWIALDLEIPSVTCAYPQTLSDRISLALLAALVLLAAPPLTYATCWVVARRRDGWSAALRSLHQRCATAYLLIFLVVHAPVSSLGTPAIRTCTAWPAACNRPTTCAVRAAIE